MDTTEELNGTYFYHGQSNLPAGELFDVIFLEQFCDELGIGIESGAAILAGQPWLKPERNRERQSKGQVLSRYGRMLLRNARTPFGIRVPTPVGIRMRKTNNLAAVIARYVPWLGWVGLVNSIYGIKENSGKIQPNSTP